MKNNRLMLLKDVGGITNHLHPRNRLIRLYNKVRKTGGWREVARLRGSKNHQYVYNFVVHGKEPPYSNPTERKACFLPLHPASPKNAKPPVPEWLQKIKKQIRRMAKSTRDSLKDR